MTAKQLLDTSLRVAESLLQLGIQSTDRIGICADNCLEFAYAIFGSIFIGAAVAPINATYTERNILKSYAATLEYIFIL